jgi:hypothetical protein
MLSLSILIVVLSTLSVARPLMAWIGQSPVCIERLADSDIIRVEDLDPNYHVFDRATALQTAGLASRALVIVRVAEQVTPQALSLPMFPGLSPEQQKRGASCVLESTRARGQRIQEAGPTLGYRP